MKRPALYIFISFAIGILLSRVFNISQIFIFGLAFISILIAIIYSKRIVISHIALYLTIICIGFLYFVNATTLPADHISRLISEDPKKISVKGRVINDPVTSRTSYHKDKVSFTLSLSAAKESMDWRNSEGLVAVNIYSRPEPDIKFGQELILEGVISKPIALHNPGLFDYTRYLEIQGIRAIMKVREGSPVVILKESSSSPVKNLAYKIRGMMREACDKYFIDPHRGFIKAIMIGDRVDLKLNVTEDFIKTGTVHAIAISGLNVGLIAGMFLSLFVLLRMPKKMALILAAIVMSVYVFIAGASPPIVRAVIIFLIFVFGYLIDRNTDALNSLALAALVMVLWNPYELYDPSFQLSFVSIASLIIFAPRINKLCGVELIGRKKFLARVGYYVITGVSVSIAAWVGTWPIVASYFNIISPVALIANLFVVPILFILTAGSFIFLSASFLFNPAALIMAKILSILDTITFGINHMLSQIPLAYFRLPAPGALTVAAYYALLFWSISPGEMIAGNYKLRKSQTLIIVLLVFNIIVWRDLAAMANKSLKVTFLDVGQADAALIELPNGKNILVDAGNGGVEDKFDAGRSVVAPYLWNKGINRLDAVVTTHFHEDHAGGMVYILNNFGIGTVIDNPYVSDNGVVSRKYSDAIKARRLTHVAAWSGDCINFSGGRVLVLNPPRENTPKDVNNNSIVLRIEYKDYGIILCGDACEAALKNMTVRYGDFLKSDVVKIPHHGGNIGGEDIVKSFLNKIGASIGIINVAKNNQYKLPSDKTLKIIKSSIPDVYLTKDCGAVSIDFE